MKFSKANSKTKKLNTVPQLAKWLKNRKVYSLDLLSGHYCPFAEKCLSKAVENEQGRRHIKDGPKTEFRCFSASQEVVYTGVYNLRKNNSEVLRKCKTSEEMMKLITEAMPKNAGIIRIHVAGDFFNPEYFDAWLQIAKSRPGVLFYAYTKSLPYWVKRINEVNRIDNLVLTASRGGKKDTLISEYGLREAVVVFSEGEAERKGLEIDNDDSHAARPDLKGNSFGLLIHGTQPKGTEAAVALSALKKG